MKVIRDKIEGDIVIKEDTNLYGMIVGLTIVSENTLLQLNGMIIGDLVLKEDSKVFLNGMVNGDIVNKGGHLEIFGMVNGKVVRKKGKTTIDSQAIVRDRVS